MSWLRRARELEEDREALEAAALIHREDDLFPIHASPERLGQLRGMDYRTEYLRSPEWRHQRAWILAATGYRCGRCGTYDKHLDVHHLTYDRLGEESPEDILALCRRCHRVEHDRELA